MPRHGGKISRDERVTNEKLWRTCRLMINGIPHKVQYHEETINYLFIPFLRRISKMQQRAGRRLVVYLAAPPGAGKTTLALFLEKLSASSPGLVGLQALSADGFLHDSKYLQENFAQRDGKTVSLAALRGSPETFDAEKLKAKLEQVKEQEIRWPVYDRFRRETVDDVKPVRKKIVLVEGCWLLLRDEPWQDLRKYCDFALFVTADPKLLRQRLIEGAGKDPKKAEYIYEKNDKFNIELALNNSWAAGETWQIAADGDYVLKADAKKPLSIVDRKSLWKKTQVAADEFTVWQNMYHKMMTMGTQAGSNEAAYAQGYGEGLSAARSEIIRRLFLSGEMTREEIMTTFQLKSYELDKILPSKIKD